MQHQITDPNYWQAYGLMITDPVVLVCLEEKLGAKMPRTNNTLYNLRLLAYPLILNECGEIIGKVCKK